MIFYYKLKEHQSVIFILLLLSVCLSIYPNEPNQQHKKTFNWGIKASLNSAIPFDWYLYSENIEISNPQTIYKVGSSVEILGRINLNRFFIQPSVAWKNSETTILFHVLNTDLLLTNQPINNYQSMYMKMRMIELPVIIGFNFVKEYPYALSIMSGVKLKYNYFSSYSINNPGIRYLGDSSPYHMSFNSALEVVIGKFTFDFGYEFGYNEIRSDFNYKLDNSTMIPIKFNRRMNAINMSIGLLF